MSDTPRTDENVKMMIVGEWVHADFARELERAGRAAEDRISELVEQGLSDRSAWTTAYQKEVEGYRRDAERYRWLRVRPSFIGWDWWQPRVPNDVLITPEFMDAAIDEKLNG